MPPMVWYGYFLESPIVGDVNLKQEAANTACERFERKKELQRRHVKLECHSRGGNMKFFGIKEHENETNKDTELAIREFMPTKLRKHYYYYYYYYYYCYYPSDRAYQIIILVLRMPLNQFNS